MKKILFIVFILLLLAIAAILFYLKKDSSDPYQNVSWGKFSTSCSHDEVPGEDYGKDFVGCDHSVPAEEIPTFDSQPFKFTHQFDSKKSLPLVGSCLIDIDNDGIDEVFVTGGLEQQDQLFKYIDSNFINISTDASLPQKPAGTSLGAVSFDLDNNGYTDLLVCGDYGISWYKNSGKGFTKEVIEVPLNDKSVAASLTLGDIDHDGDADMFVSAYIKKEKMEGQTIFKDKNYGASSLMMINNGDNTFTDMTEKMGLTYTHNTFFATLIDVDNDGYLDLVVAHDTGEVRTYKNQSGNTFSMVSNPMTGKYGYPMGIGVGDYNNDGNADFFFSNTGSSVPSILARGDLEKEDVFIGKWLLYRNDGGFKFTDVAEQTKIADFEFSWGAIFEDYNLDGRQDLVVAENYVAFPPHKLFKLPCRFLIQRPDETFAAVEEQAGVVNKNYGITPLSSDFNADGYPDLIYINIDGPVRAFINKGGSANYVGVRLPETAEYLGSKVTVTKMDGGQLSDFYIIGEGLASDQTSTLTFGLGSDESIKSITLHLPNGQTRNLSDVSINRVHRI